MRPFDLLTEADLHAKLEKHLTPDAIKRTTSYYKNLKFKSEEEAREKVFYDLQRWDKESWARVVGANGPELNRLIADKTPIFKIGNSWKIGKRTVQKKPDPWESIDVRRPSLAPLEAAGWLNPFDGYEVLGIQMKPVTALHMVEDHSYTQGGIERVYRLAEEIKENEWFNAIVIDSEGTILDGHHRFRAVRDVLKWKTIPCLVVRLGHDEEDED